MIIYQIMFIYAGKIETSVEIYICGKVIKSKEKFGKSFVMTSCFSYDGLVAICYV